jgi:hypothetical protein
LVLVEFREECGLNANQRLAGFSCHRLVGFQTAVAANVEHGVAALGENAADEQAAMAVGWVFLAAKQGYTEAFHAGLKAADGRLEAGVVAEPAVKNTAFGIVISGIGGAATQLLAKEEVTDSRLLQRALHEFLVELRDVLRVGRAARIDHHLNPVLADEGEPCFEVVVGVTEGEETAHAQALAEEDSTEAVVRL